MNHTTVVDYGRKEIRPVNDSERLQEKDRVLDLMSKGPPFATRPGFGKDASRSWPFGENKEGNALAADGSLLISLTDPEPPAEGAEKPPEEEPAADGSETARKPVSEEDGGSRDGNGSEEMGAGKRGGR
eukprot:SAG22_NODE_8803_length_629_cov_0.633962_1_plen_128_part_10